MSEFEIYVVVLNWNGLLDTRACLHSLANIDHPRFHVIVSDNGSTDGSVDAIRRLFPSVQLIENHENLGFAAGNNRAISYALEHGATFVLLLNNDTVVDAEILSEFSRAANSMPSAGIFGPKIYHYSNPDVLWYAGGYWSEHTLSFEERGAGERDAGQFDTLTETEWVIGCAMFVRADVFRTVGLLEPRYFLNNEEVDFCCRARRAGFSCAYVPTARLWHKVSASFGGEYSPLKEYFSARNRLLWAGRNAGRWLQLRIHVRSTIAILARYVTPVIGRATRTPLSARAWWWSVRDAFGDPRNRAALLGLRDFWLGRFGNCPEEVRKLNADWATRQTTLGTPTARNGSP